MLVPATGESVALGVVPVAPPAGGGGDVPALWRVHGIPLVRHAVSALAGHVGEIRVPVPSDLEGSVSAVLAGCRARVVSVPGTEPGPLALVAAALRVGDPSGFDAVVVGDPLHMPLQASLVPAVLAALLAPDPDAPGAVAVAGRVTDTLVWVGPADLVTGTADRDRFREVLGPYAYRTPTLLRALDQVDDTPPPEPALARLAAAAGARWLPGTADVCVIAAAEDLALAESLIDLVG